LVFEGADEPSEDCKGTFMARLCLCDGSKVVWSLAPVSYVVKMSGDSNKIRRKKNLEIR
jgi:hypothetical protein